MTSLLLIKRVQNTETGGSAASSYQATAPYPGLDWYGGDAGATERTSFMGSALYPSDAVNVCRPSCSDGPTVMFFVGPKNEFST